MKFEDLVIEIASIAEEDIYDGQIELLLEKYSLRPKDKPIYLNIHKRIAFDISDYWLENALSKILNGKERMEIE